MGFGLFVHWSVDSQIGSVVSHSMVGASKSYNQKFIEFLPKQFNPKRFDAEDWATLFALSGAKYVVVNAKHHYGFCMFNSQVTDFDIVNTPFGRDLAGELIPELRKKGLAVGVYFSPDDFWFLHNQGYSVSRRRMKRGR